MQMMEPRHLSRFALRVSFPSSFITVFGSGGSF